MWIFSQYGFISVVRHNAQRDKVLVRSRDLKSLELLQTLSELQIEHTPDADYPYRVIVPEDMFKRYMEIEMEEITYPNFKNRAYSTRGNDYGHLLTEVWGTMHELEDKQARAKKKPVVERPEAGQLISGGK